MAWTSARRNATGHSVALATDSWRACRALASCAALQVVERTCSAAARAFEALLAASQTQATPLREGSGYRSRGPAPGHLEGSTQLCVEHGPLLVIDEVITGFRLGPTGAEGVLGIHGDSSIYAKAIATWFSLAVFGTTNELLAGVGRGEINHSGTYNAGVSSLAAGVATLLCLIDCDPFHEMNRVTQRLVDGLRTLG